MDTHIEEAAMHAHEANRVICEMNGDVAFPWATAPESQRDSARKGVYAIMERPDASPEYMHDEWCKHKVAQGWVYGAEKSEEKKTHPCLCSYDALPFNQRAKDFVFIAAAKAHLRLMGKLNG